MRTQITRRRMLQAGGGAAGLVFFQTASHRRGAAAQDTIEIRAAGFVESQDQLRQTVAVLEAYTAEHPDVVIQPEFTDYGSYTDRLATEAAGGNAPDLMSTNADIMAEYSRRGVIRPLDEYVPDPIDLSDYADGTVAGNTMNGSLFGIPNDCISPALVYDTTVFEETGIAVPEQMWTWEEYAQLANDISAAMGEGFYGTEDGGGSYIQADVFFRGMGKDFYGPDRTLGFNEEDLTAWYEFWQQLRESGGAPPGDVQALATGDDLSQTGLIAGRAAILPQLTDTFVGLQNLTENPLGLHMVPNGFEGGTLEQHLYTYAGNSSSISSQTEHADVVIDIINFMHSDPEGSTIFYGGSGMIPAAAAGREALREEGSPGEITALNYIELILSSTAPPRNPAISGVSAILGRMNEEVAFGRLSPAEAAAQFFAEAASRIS